MVLTKVAKVWALLGSSTVSLVFKCSASKCPSTQWDFREIFVRFWPWDFCDTSNICDTTWNICEQWQTKSHKSLIVWAHLEQSQTFVRFCWRCFLKMVRAAKCRTFMKHYETMSNKFSSCGCTPTHQTSVRFSWDLCSTLFHECFLTRDIKHRETTSNIIEQNLTKISSCGRDGPCDYEHLMPANNGIIWCDPVECFPSKNSFEIWHLLPCQTPKARNDEIKMHFNSGNIYFQKHFWTMKQIAFPCQFMIFQLIFWTDVSEIGLPLRDSEFGNVSE
jgi:hypothetical protein